MTRDKAIETLATLQDGSGGTYEAIRMAIEALMREAHDGCDGCIYELDDELTELCYSCKQNYMDRYMPEPKHDRDWIIGCIKHDGFIKTDRGDKANQIILEALEADRPRGKWIVHGEPPWYVRECSGCRTKWHQWSGDSNPNYCGNCGAKMDGERSEE